MNEVKRRHKIKKCSVCNHDFNGLQVADEITCPECHTRYDLVNKKTDRSQTLVAPVDCNHRRKRLVCGMESDAERYTVYICLDCGEIHVIGTKNREHYHVEFTIDTDESLAAVGKFAKLIGMEDE